MNEILSLALLSFTNFFPLLLSANSVGTDLFVLALFADKSSGDSSEGGLQTESVPRSDPARKPPPPTRRLPKKLPFTVKFNARKKNGSILLISMRLPDHYLFPKTLVKMKNSFDMREFQRLMQDPKHMKFVGAVMKIMMTRTSTSLVVYRDGGMYDHEWYINGARCQVLTQKSKMCG